jgi:hypothetical protein
MNIPMFTCGLSRTNFSFDIAINSLTIVNVIMLLYPSSFEKVSIVIHSNKIKVSLTTVRSMFRPFRRLVEVFREKGATTPEKALTWKELGFPEDLEHMSPQIPPDKSPIVKKGRKYYLSEERLKEFRDEFAPLRKWIQHTAKVPKGFLRYRVLHKLKEGPMSGSELTVAIAEEMGGRWKPKPGSMYPLLRSLLQDGLTQEVPVEDGRTRR